MKTVRTKPWALPDLDLYSGIRVIEIREEWKVIEPTLIPNTASLRDRAKARRELDWAIKLYRHYKMRAEQQTTSGEKREAFQRVSKKVDELLEAVAALDGRAMASFQMVAGLDPYNANGPLNEASMQFPGKTRVRQTLAVTENLKRWAEATIRRLPETPKKAPDYVFDDFVKKLVWVYEEFSGRTANQSTKAGSARVFVKTVCEEIGHDYSDAKIDRSLRKLLTHSKTSSAN